MLDKDMNHKIVIALLIAALIYLGVNYIFQSKASGETFQPLAYQELPNFAQRMMDVTNVPGTVENVEAIYKPDTYNVLPQQGLIPDTPWQQVSSHMTNPTRSFNNNFLDWRSIASSTCASHNGSIAPRSQQDCPDSSFTYVTDMGRLVAGAKGPGCIQLGISSQPFCYSDKQGNYHPWWDKLKVSSA